MVLEMPYRHCCPYNALILASVYITQPTRDLSTNVGMFISTILPKLSFNLTNAYNPDPLRQL